MRVTASQQTYNLSAQPTALADASVTSVGGVLTIEGGDKNDKIEVKNGTDGLDVTINGQKYHFDDAEYAQGLVVKGGKGKDDIRIAHDVKGSVTVDGGAGNDRISSSKDGAVLRGGDGKDEIQNFGRGATLQGDGGADKLQNNGGSGARILGDDRDDIMNAASDSFVRGGKKSHVTSVGDRNTVEVAGKAKVIVVGDDNRITGKDGYEVWSPRGNGNVYTGGERYDRVEIKGERNKVYGNGGGDRIEVEGKGNEVFRRPIKA